MACEDDFYVYMGLCFFFQGTFIFFVAVLLTAQTLGRRSPDMADPEQRYITQSFILPSTKGSEVGLDKCKLCVQFAQQATSNLLNIILSESWYYTE